MCGDGVCVRRKKNEWNDGFVGAYVGRELGVVGKSVSSVNRGIHSRRFEAVLRPF